MTDMDEPAEDFNPNRFPLSTDDIFKIEKVIKLVRERLPTMIHQLTFEALPACSSLWNVFPPQHRGFRWTFGFVQPNTDGNYGWADIF